MFTGLPRTGGPQAEAAPWAGSGEMSYEETDWATAKASGKLPGRGAVPSQCHWPMTEDREEPGGSTRGYGTPHWSNVDLSAPSCAIHPNAQNPGIRPPKAGEGLSGTQAAPHHADLLAPLSELTTRRLWASKCTCPAARQACADLERHLTRLLLS